MYSVSDAEKTRKRRRTLTLILITVLAAILTIPSFADNGSGGPAGADAGAVIDAETGGSGETDAAEEPAPADVQKAEDEALPQEDTDQVTDNEDGADISVYIDETAAAEEEGAEEARDPEAKAEGTAKEAAPRKTVKSTAKAASDDAKTVTYSGSKVGSAAGETTIFSVTSGGTSYTGTCAKQGVNMSSSGTATITKISNGKKIAKIVYHYAIELGDDNWWTGEHKTDKVGKLLGMSNDGDTNVTKRRMIEAFCQIYNMGTSDWYSTITNANTGGWNTGTADKVRDFYTDISEKNWYKDLTVPDGFEIWFADAGNAQPFMIWSYNPKGYATVKKVSADTSVTG